ncbi:hypothetical protein M3N64_02290 [Sporolactobacillus sp. CPB3-1]|uniref:Uncharacterized protein n=1 Tax=Sporolactobacillus mangiferae TaxID=2940498 RepID=A0ABT0M945_9BACL|nr:hypothetical protein [Sporolactobacillus mangiferae]MCL1630784.1 hypothetical protein [Sporolactobacillus mangiferae]
MKEIKAKDLDHLNNRTSDKDLVKIAGFYAYKEYKVGTEIWIQGHEYVIRNKVKDKTGLNAIVIKNLKTSEYTVVFQGTQVKGKYGMHDMITDIQLLGSTEPEQVKAARAYFDRMNKKYGVHSVCGNSLGGALANSVAVHHKNVRAVTLDPAILPEGMVKADREYPNVTNYFTKYDGLTRGELGLNLGDRFPGRIYQINSGVPYFSRAFASNHVGYNGEDPQTIEIGKKGEPGYGTIEIAADEHIVTSIWTGEPLYGGSSGRIKINKASLDTLADALKSQVLARLKRASDYIQNANEIVAAEKAQRAHRLAKLEKQFESILEDGFGNSPLFKGMAAGGYMIQSVLDHLQQQLLNIDVCVRSIEHTIFSPPAKITQFVSVKGLGLSGLIDQALRSVHDLRHHFDQLSRNTSRIVKQDLPRLIANETTGAADAVVDAFYKHEVIVGKHHKTLYRQIEIYRKQVRETGRNFQNADIAVAAGSGATPSNQISVHSSVGPSLEPSNNLPYRTKTKAIQVNHAKNEFKMKLQTELTPVVGTIYGTLATLEGISESISGGIKFAGNAIWYGSLPTLLIGLFTDWDERLNRNIRHAMKPLDDFSETIHAIKKGISYLNAYLPRLTATYAPFIETAIFKSDRYTDVITYNGAAADSLEEMELLFQDIVHQLSDQQAVAITALESQSRKILKNIKQLHTDVQRGA